MIENHGEIGIVSALESGGISKMNSQPKSQPGDNERLSAHLIAQINVKLALIGCAPVVMKDGSDFSDIVSAMAGLSREKDRLLGQYLCPADQRIQTFLYACS